MLPIDRRPSQHFPPPKGDGAIPVPLGEGKRLDIPSPILAIDMFQAVLHADPDADIIAVEEQYARVAQFFNERNNTIWYLPQYVAMGAVLGRHPQTGDQLENPVEFIASYVPDLLVQSDPQDFVQDTQDIFYAYMAQRSIKDALFERNFVAFEGDQTFPREGRLLRVGEEFPDVDFMYLDNESHFRALSTSDFSGTTIINTLNGVTEECTDVCDDQIKQWEEAGYPEGVTVLWATRQFAVELAAYADEHGISRNRLLSMNDETAKKLGVKLENGWALRQTTVTKTVIKDNGTKVITTIYNEPVANQAEMSNREAALAAV